MFILIMAGIAIFFPLDFESLLTLNKIWIWNHDMVHYILPRSCIIVWQKSGDKSLFHWLHLEYCQLILVSKSAKLNAKLWGAKFRAVVICYDVSDPSSDYYWCLWDKRCNLQQFFLSLVYVTLIFKLSLMKITWRFFPDKAHNSGSWYSKWTCWGLP